MGLDQYLRRRIKLDKSEKEMILSKAKSCTSDELETFLYSHNYQFINLDYYKGNVFDGDYGVIVEESVDYLNMEKKFNSIYPNEDYAKYTKVGESYGHGEIEIAFKNVETKDIVNVTITDEDFDKFKIIEMEKGIVYLKPKEEIYWRKSNWLRQWMIDNADYPEDGNCIDWLVSNEKLKKLIDDINNVLNNKEKAKDILSTSSGFFFGDTDYNNYYFTDLETTQRELLKLNLDSDDNDYFYSEWW